MGKSKTRKGKKKLPVRAALVVLAAACIGIGGWHYVSGNKPEGEEPVDKEAYYNGWCHGGFLPLDGKLLTVRAGEGGKVTIRYGKLENRGFEMLSISKNGSEFILYRTQELSGDTDFAASRIQYRYYLKDSSGWHQSEDTDEERYEAVWDAAVKIRRLRVQNGKYEKTENGLDAILCTIPDIDAMEKEEKEEEEASAVVDDGYGNDVPVVIFDPENQKEKDQKFMEVRLWLDESGEIRRMEWPADGPEYTVQKLKAELPEGAKEGEEEEGRTFTDRMEQAYINVVSGN